MNLIVFASEYNNLDNELSILEINLLKSEILSCDVDINTKSVIFLEGCGMDSKWIKGLPIELRTSIFENCIVAGNREEYCVADENGNEKNISKTEFELEKLSLKNNSSNIRTNDNTSPKVLNDNYFKKSLYWYYLEDGSGYYIFMVTYEWLRLPVIRNTDVLTMSATSGAFADGTSGCYFSYNQTVAQSGTINTTTY